MRTALGIIRLVRPHNVAAAALSTAVGFAMAGGGSWPWLLVSAVALCTAAGNTINDWYDFDIDRYNKPARPLPSGAVSRQGALALYIVLLVTFAALLAALPAPQAVWLIVWALLLHLYSARLKRVYLAGNLLVAAVSASGFLLGARAGGAIAAGVVPSGFTFVFVLGRELVKDCEDAPGDRLIGARTVPVVAGERAALGAAVVIFAVLAVGFPLPGLVGMYRSAYTLIMLTTVVPLIVVAAVLSARGRALGLVSLLLKAGMFFGIVAFYLGSP